MSRTRFLLLAAALSGLTAIGARRALLHLDIASPAARLAIALIPVPFFLLLIFAEFRWIRAQDEFHRRVVLDSLAIAFPAAIAFGVTVDVMQGAGFLTRVTVGDVWPIMALTWFPALWIARRRYR